MYDDIVNYPGVPHVAAASGTVHLLVICVDGRPHVLVNCALEWRFIDARHSGLSSITEICSLMSLLRKIHDN